MQAVQTQLTWLMNQKLNNMQKKTQSTLINGSESSGNSHKKNKRKSRSLTDKGEYLDNVTSPFTDVGKITEERK